MSAIAAAPSLAAALVFTVGTAAAAPARPAHDRPGTRTVAMLGITGGVGMDPKTLTSLEEIVLAALSAGGRFERVIGRTDIASVLGWEEKKQKMGCDESSACIAEVAGALGVDLIAAADLGRFGTVSMLTLKFIDAGTAKVLVRALRKVPTDADLPDVVPALVEEAIARLDAPAGATAAAPAAKSPAPAAAIAAPPEPARTGEAKAPGASGGTRTGFWIATGATVLAAGAGGYFVSTAMDGASRGATATDRAAADAARSDTERGALGASVSFGTAGVAAVAAAVLWWLERDAGPQPARP